MGTGQTYLYLHIRACHEIKKKSVLNIFHPGLATWQWCFTEFFLFLCFFLLFINQQTTGYVHQMINQIILHWRKFMSVPPLQLRSWLPADRDAKWVHENPMIFFTN